MEELKKDSTKDRKRMASLARDYTDATPIKESPHKTKMIKFVQDLKNFLQNKNFDLVEKTLIELSRLLHPRVSSRFLSHANSNQSSSLFIEPSERN